MKITICSASYPPSLWNSIGRTCYSISQGLAALGHSVTVVTYNPATGDKFARDKNVRIQYLGIEGDATLPIDKVDRWQLSVTEFLKRYCKNTDAFICIDSYGYKAIADSGSKAKVISLCNFLYASTGWLQRIGKDLESQLLSEELDFVKNSAVVLCNNKVTRHKVAALVNRTVESYTVGIPVIKGFEHLPKKRQVLYVGKLNREKGVERILRVMPQLPWLHLVLCDQNSNNSYKVIIDKLATEMGITDRVAYTGFLSTQNVWRLYAESEICVVPHIAEPWGYSAIYPMMLGTPTIVSTAHSLPEILGDEGDCGAVFSNIGELRYYLDEIHNMQSLQDMYSANGREKVISERSLDAMVASIAKYL